MNVAYLLDRAGCSWPDLPAVARGDAMALDYRGLATRCAALATGLTVGLGLTHGDRVALVMRNCPEYVETLFACWWAGLIAVPINARLHPREIAYILETSEATATFVTEDLAGAVDEASPNPGMPVIGAGSAEYTRLCARPTAPLAGTDPDDVAWLFFTSGTTGRPKGAMLSHRNLIAMIASYLADVDTIAPGHSIIHAAPMSHGSGLYILPNIAKAATQVIPESGGFDPAEVFALCRAWPGATLFGAPTMIKRLTAGAQADGDAAAGLRTIVYGGGPMYLADLQDAHAVFGFRLAQIYGQGESPMCITALDKALHADTGHPRYLERLSSAGIPQLSVQVRIADADGNPLPHGEAGEVLVRGDAVMRGYWRNPEATAQALRGGWLWTGDIGTLDEEGFLTLRDRSKDLIISGGVNIYPREVEEVLLEHPGVREVSVVGRPDPGWGEAVIAFVVREAGVAPADMADEAALDALCQSRIARFKRPKEYRFVAELPKNSYGKVLKTELRRLIGAGDAG